jgi:MFS family permease
MEKVKKEPLLSPLMRWFLFAMVLANVASAMYSMLMPIYLTELGASITQVGLIFTLTSVVILILQVFGGWVSDSIGRLRSIAIGSVGGILGFLAVMLAPTWQWMLAALCVLQFPYALVGPSFGAFIAENSTTENRGKVYGITDTIFQITGVVGPPLGGFLVGQHGFKIMFLVSGSLYTVAAILRIWMATMVRTTTEARPQVLSTASLKTSLKTMFGMILGGGVLTWIFITDGVRDIAFRLSGELQPLYLEQIAGINVEQIGILGSIFSIAMMFTPILSGKMVDKYGERVPISLGFLLVFGAFMIFLQVDAFIGFAICWVVFGTGVGLLSPAYQSLVSKVVPQKMLGTFTGLFRSSLGLISLPAPYLGAQLWERFSPQTPFAITAVAALITIIPTWLFFKVPDDKADKSSHLETATIMD